MTRVIGLAVITLLVCGHMVIPVWAQDSNSQPTLGRHFIVLIDDSCSIAGCKEGTTDRRSNIKNDLPDRLFGGIKGLPAINPEDRLSVLFFTILGSARDCDSRQARSASPEDIFKLLYSDKVPSKEVFSNMLSGWISNPCYFKGEWSPIVSSSLLVLPYMQSQPRLPKGELHSQTFLIQVTDGEFNSRTTPGYELTDYYRTGISHVRETDHLLSQVSSLFSLKIFPDQRPFNGVFYLAAEYSSQRVPESAVQYQRNSLLYPQAISSGELSYRLNDQLLGDIQLLSQGSGAAYDFRPLWLRVGFQNKQGGDWRIGQETLPRWSEATKSISLNPCQSPVCKASENNDRLGIGLFEAGLERPLKVSTTDADPEPGQVKFSVGFHYDNRIYDHLCVETPEMVIDVDPAKPPEIPNLFSPSSRLNKSDVAGEWQSDDDGVTTQEEAKNRVLARQKIYWLRRILLIAGLAALLTILVTIILVLKYYKRRFLPGLNWIAAPEVVVDFNRPATSRVLVCRLQIENDQPVPWLGRLLRNKEQPTRNAEFSLNYDYFRESGLELAGDHPIGFMRGADTGVNSEALDRTTSETVSNGREVHVFLATETIKDYHAGDAKVAVTGAQDARFTVPVKTKVEWTTQQTGGSTKQLKPLEADIECNLIVKPEEPRKPLVTYTAVKDAELYFKKNTLVQIGSFWFESRATHKFAQPYRWNGYTIQTYLGNRQLTGEPIRLAQSTVEVASRTRVEVPVYIDCDNQTIPNPDSKYCEYSFRLIGDYSAESETGPYITRLYRDRSRAEIELRLIKQQLPQAEPWLEIYWTPAGVMKLRTLPDGADADHLLDGPNLIRLDPKPITFNSKNPNMRALLNLEIGNSCDVGDGMIDVEIKASIKCDQWVQRSIEMIEGRELDDLIGVYDFKQPQPNATIRAGKQAQSRAVYLIPAHISKIISGRIEHVDIKAEVDLIVHINDGQGSKSERTFKIIIPFSLEQLPGIHWLAIDFGTSAISAAWGYGRDKLSMIPLQKITVPDGRSFAEHDLENAEKGNNNLLPSWICCNWDLRNASGDKYRPGFPGYYSENLSDTPGKPEYIGLPAVTHEFEEHPGRIIYSLKSWLGTASPNILIHIKNNGREISKLLPMEEMVESGFSALKKAYLFKHDADRVVITHPNTFTQRHRDLLRRIVCQALGIPLKDRVKLISESDAIAYYYCIKQTQPSPGVERILVYDFGAGTLDLSLIKVVWKKDPPRYPIEWTVEKQLGVPVAGNYIDEILARLIHQLLSKREIVEAKGFEYYLPIVGRVHDLKDLHEHRRGIIRLWKWIREAKHTWSNKCRAVLEQGGSLDDCPPFTVQVGIGNELEVVRYASGQVPNPPEPIDEPGLWVADMGDIYLSIPAHLIIADKRMTEFMNFVTDEVISELLAGATIAADDVNTVIVSGRGARYTDLREKVQRRFPHANMPRLTDEEMKSAVVHGAIARQGLSKKFSDASNDQVPAPQIAVLRNDETDLVFEKDWTKPINLENSPTFRLVQVNLKNPNPREDMKSFRKHFYIDLTDQDFSREDILGDDKYLYIGTKTRNGELAIDVWGEHGQSQTVFEVNQNGQNVTTPPWPVGNMLLDPEE